MTMKTTGAAVCCAATVLLAIAAPDQAAARTPVVEKGKATMQHATGSFEVKLTPQTQSGPAADAGVGRMSIDKVFHGDLEGTGKGEMLAAMTAVEGSAGYVAIEQVTATLGGRSGTFVLQHSGLATAKSQNLVITIVPDSGTGGLVGISGTFGVRIEPGGKHFYDLEYLLP